jgi:uncharacterized membrane protein YvbJ
MRYCRKCGAELDDDARCCRVCGAPVEPYAEAASVPYTHESRSRPLPWAVVGILIAILVVACVVAGLVFIPLQSKLHQHQPSTSRNWHKHLYLNIAADIANINVLTTSLQVNLFKVTFRKRCVAF